jgi:flagellar basal body rod protein FlgF
MAMTSDAQMLAEFGQRVNAMGAQCGEFANRATAGFPHSCDTPKAKQIHGQAEQLSTILKQCSELANQIHASAMQEASRIVGGG